MVTVPTLEELQRLVVIDAGGCWLWQGELTPDGYAHIAHGIYAHRVAFALVNGPIAKGHHLDHLCRTRRCCNPSHMEAVTVRENLMRGDTLAAKNAAKTHCPSDHPLSGDNLYRAGGRRFCRICRATAGARYKDKLKTARHARGDMRRSRLVRLAAGLREHRHVHA